MCHIITLNEDYGTSQWRSYLNHRIPLITCTVVLYNFTVSYTYGGQIQYVAFTLLFRLYLHNVTLYHILSQKMLLYHVSLHMNYHNSPYGPVGVLSLTDLHALALALLALEAGGRLV